MKESTLFRLYGVMVESSTGGLSTERKRLVELALTLSMPQQLALLAQILGGWQIDGQLTVDQLHRMIRGSYGGRG